MIENFINFILNFIKLICIFIRIKIFRFMVIEYLCEIFLGINLSLIIVFILCSY